MYNNRPTPRPLNNTMLLELNRAASNESLSHSGPCEHGLTHTCATNAVPHFYISILILLSAATTSPRQPLNGTARNASGAASAVRVAAATTPWKKTALGWRFGPTTRASLRFAARIQMTILGARRSLSHRSAQSLSTTCAGARLWLGLAALKLESARSCRKHIVSITAGCIIRLHDSAPKWTALATFVASRALPSLRLQTNGTDSSWRPSCMLASSTC